MTDYCPRTLTKAVARAICHIQKTMKKVSRIIVLPALLLSVFGSALFADVRAAELPNLTPYWPNDWTDAIVISAKLGAVEDSVSIYTNNTVYVSFAIVNTTAADTGIGFNVEMIIDGVLKKTWSYSPLNANRYRTLTDYNIGLFPLGLHEIRIRIDPTDVVEEFLEHDNLLIRTFSVIDYPDPIVL